MTASDPLDPELRTRQRLSAIAHAGATMWGPVGEATLAALVDQLERSGIVAGDLLLDLGCGPAELLRRVCERTAASGVGIDTSPEALAEAARRLATSPARERVELRAADATNQPREGRAAVALCIGPGWVTGGWAAMTEWMTGFVRPGGHLVLGEGAWAREPSRSELQALGMTLDDYPATDEVEAAVRRHSDPLWRHRSTDDEWDAYAAAYRSSLSSFATEHPDHELAPAAAQRAGPGWATFELLHELLDFVIVFARRPTA